MVFFQERALQLVDKTEGDFTITEGINLVQTEEQSQARSLDEVQLSDDEETREQEVDSLLVDRVARFLGSHTLQFKIPKDSIKDVQRSLEEGNETTATMSSLPRSYSISHEKKKEKTVDLNFQLTV